MELEYEGNVIIRIVDGNIIMIVFKEQCGYFYIIYIVLYDLESLFVVFYFQRE